MAEVELLGADRLIARCHNFADDLDPVSAKAVLKVAGMVRDTARSVVRVDTASLQKSIRTGQIAKPAGHTVSVRVTAGGYIVNPKTGKLVDYAVLVHDGTSRMAPNPYMALAVEVHRMALAKAILWGIS